MILAQRERYDLRIIWCPVCEAYWMMKGESNVSCCVNHGPGRCCHYLWEQVSARGVDQIHGAIATVMDGELKVGGHEV